MSKRNFDTTEHSREWEDGTYQTGSARPQKEHRGLIAVLMILVIFLGGIASMMGLLNIRLLQKIAQSDVDADNVPMYADYGSNDFQVKNGKDAATPSMPSQAQLHLQLQEPEQEVLTAQEIWQENQASIVSVHCLDPQSAPVTWGVVIDEAGFILTNAYPVSDCSHIYVSMADGRSFRAAVVGSDEFTDLAVLYISAPELTAARFVTSDALQDGDRIVALGADGQTLEGSLYTQGSAYQIGSDSIRLLHTDLGKIYGPVFNHCGQLVGFGSPFLSENDTGMAIPSLVVRDVAAQIIQNGTMSGRPCLGVEVEEVQKLHQQYWQLPQGLRVTRISGENPALSGLEPGDILIELNGLPVTDRESLCTILRTLHLGDQVNAKVLRGNQTMTITVTIQVSGESE